MASKTDNKKKSAKGAKNSGKKAPAKKKNSGLNDEQKKIVRVLFGVVCAILCALSAIALISFIFTWKADQSLLDNPNFSANSVEAGNAVGKIGFKSANFLVSRILGVGAFFIPFFLGAIAVKALKIKEVRLFRCFLLCAFGSVVISVFFAWLAEFFPIGRWFANGPGGLYGGAAAEWLTSMLGTIGAGATVLFALLVWLTFITRRIVLWIDRMATRPRRARKSEIENSEEREVLEIEPDGLDNSDNSDSLDDPDDGSIVEEEGESDDLTPWYAKAVSDEGDNPASMMDGEEEIPDMPAEIAAESDLDSDPDGSSDREEEGGEEDEVSLVVESDPSAFLETLSAEEQEHLFNPRLDLSRYEFPSLGLLEDYRDKWYEMSKDELEKNKRKIVNALGSYKISVESIVAKVGPTVTLYKIHLATGIKIAQVKRLEEDLAMSLGAKGVRVLVLDDAVGIEVANERASVVPLKMVLNSPQFKEKSSRMELPVAMGINVTNEPFFFDLAKTPHLLIAGATGTGKSVGLNALIASLLFTKHPAEMKLVMVDPKRVELDFYRALEKHYLAMTPDAEESVITDTRKVVDTLNSLVQEMEDRYEVLKQAKVRKITEYNDKFLARRLNPLKGHKYMPYIVVIIDEFADLLMTVGKEIETPIARLAQKARAVGIHLVIATQRPTTDVITGTIKANFPSRIAFKVMSAVDSKTILDQSGAQRLIGRGDMLAVVSGMDLDRVQCALIETEEVEAVTNFIGSQRGYEHAFFLPEVADESESEAVKSVDLNKRDALFEEAARVIVMNNQGSTSLLQRKLGVGYAKAGRLMDQLEMAGIVGPYCGSKAREVLITDLDSLDRKIRQIDNS